MIKNYILTAYRNILRNKFYSFLNIVGLSIGVVCTLLIILYIQNELSYDKHYEKHNRVYRLESNFSIKGKHDLFAVTALPLAKVIKQDYPEVENYVRMAPTGNALLKYEEQKFFEDSLYFADSTYFELFSHKFLQGDAKDALNNPFSIVLTRNLAEKIFGKNNPVGKTLLTGQNRLYKVTGVIENLPQNTHLRFSGLMSMNTLAELFGKDNYNSTKSDAFWNVNFYSYILLKDNASIENIISKSKQLYEKYMAEIGKQIGGDFTLMATRLDKIHFNTSNLQADQEIGNFKYIYIFAIIAFFILIIGSINYMNMATARSTNRAKEVGLRKVVGGLKSMLIKQFLSESMIMAFLSLIIALILLILLLPVFNDIAGKQLSYDIITKPSVIGLVVLITFLIGFVSGVYPAFFMSNFKPVDVLKGKGSSAKIGGNLRKILVIVQFSITAVMIIGTIVVSRQLSFMRNMDLGFNKENIVVFQEQDTAFIKKTRVFKEELKKSSDIISSSNSNTAPGLGLGIQVTRVEKNGEMVEVALNNFRIDHEFFDLYEMKLIKGRNFDKNLPTDYNGSFLINETAAKKLGWGDDALGKKIQWGFDLKGNVRKNGKVIGVVKDFHYKSLHNPIEPLLLMIDSAPSNVFCVKINPKGRQKAIDFIKTKRDELQNSFPFKYIYLDEELDKFYKSEQQIATIFTYFTILTIIIAILGMIGLSAFMTEQRTKEIGIRKVLGATESSVVFLFSKQFAKWVLIANLFAWIIAYIAMNKWLEDFIFRWISTIGESMGIWLFLAFLTLIITTLLALFTVAWQVIKTAIMNPVESLKYE